MFNRLSFVLLAAVVLVPEAFSADDPEPKDMAKIQVPAGHSVLFKLEAKGFQIYKSVEGVDGKFKWVFEAPLANLYDNTGKHVGRHFEGPAWESTDGSKVKKIEKDDPIKVDAPVKENIPWLLLHVKSDSGGKEGAFSKVQYIQRIQTKGGVMPAELPTKAGIRVFIEYAAVYALYE